MRLGLELWVLQIFFGVLAAQCPAPNELKDESGTKICARMFEDSHYIFEQSCGGKYLDAMNGDDVPFMPLLWNDRISSMVVGTRCELRVWSNFPKLGDNRKFSSGVYYQLKDYKNGLLDTWNNEISSYYCTCN